MLKKLFAFFLAATLAVGLSACSMNVLFPEAQLSILNGITQETDMTFELMEEWPEEPLKALLIFDGTQLKEEKTEYYSEVSISGNRNSRHRYICAEKKTIVLFGRYFHPAQKGETTVGFENSDYQSIRFPETNNLEFTEIPLSSSINKSELPVDAWRIYIVYDNEQHQRTYQLKEKFKQDISFLLSE